MSGTSSPATAERPAAVRRGSRFSDKQIAHAVKDYRHLTISAVTGEELAQGFVYGMDDFHIGIVDTNGNTRLVHKSAAAVISFDTFPTFVALASEVRAMIEETCGAFRSRVMREHFSQTSAAQ